MSTRLLGIVMIIGMLVDTYTAGPEPGGTYTELAYTLFGIGGMCGIASAGEIVKFRLHEAAQCS